MKIYVKESSTNIILQVKFEEYERYSSGSLRSARVSGSTLLEALKKMCDNMGLYLDSDEIEEEGYTAEEVIESIISSNGDGCDYIYFLKNLTTGEVYIDSYEPDEEEEWE